MADLTQSSQTTATTTPSYYTDYLSNLATKGTAAGAAVPVAAWDPTALQNKAFTDVNTNVGNYQPGLTTAGQTFTNAGATDITGAADPYLKAGTTTSGLTQANPYLTSGTSSAAPLVADYMNPYTSNVVDQIRLANQQNIQQNLSPGLTAGAVGGGQFGSQRGANALALGISNANIGALGKQAEALQSGYAQALAAAQAQRAAQVQAGSTAGTLQNQFNTNQTTAGQVAGNMAGQQGQLLRDVGTGQAALANQQQTQGLADVNALATLGAQQQTIAQNKALAPLDILGKQASIMSGAQLPTTVKTEASGSPLSAIAGLGSLAMGLNTKNASGSTPWQNIMNSIGLGGAGGSSIQTANNAFQSADGTWYPTQAAAGAADTAYLSGYGAGSSTDGSSYFETGTNKFQAADDKWYPTQAEADAADTAYLGE
jgi:hypothetical protein